MARLANSVGWVERSETHRGLARMVGFAALNPPYETYGIGGA